MLSFSTAAALTLVATVAAISPAAAQGVCASRAAIVAELERRYGETRRSARFQEGRGVFEVFASETTGSWTVVLTSRQGRSCLVAAGKAGAGKLARADAPF